MKLKTMMKEIPIIFSIVCLIVAMAIIPVHTARGEGLSRLTGAIEEPASIPNFGGVYVGVGAVYSQGDLDADIAIGPVPFGAGVDLDDFGVAASILAQTHLGGSRWVAGLELGGTYAQDISSLYGGVRLGYAISNNLLPYVHAGVGVDLADDVTVPIIGPVSITAEDSQYTARAGVGVQWKLSKYWSIDAQYAHIWAYGSDTTINIGPAALANIDIDSERDQGYLKVRRKF